MNIDKNSLAQQKLYKNPIDDAEFVVSKKILDRLRLYKTVRVKHDVFMSADYDIDFHQFRVLAERDILADHIADDYYSDYVTFDYPATTWQMFKQTHEFSWWLGWLVRRYPVQRAGTVKSVSIKVKRYLGYPEAKVPNMGRPIIYETVERLYD